jgi:hypothetical protein
MEQHCGDDTRRWYQSLFSLGERAFPAYEAILADPQSTPRDVVWVCVFLHECNLDRRRFAPAVVRRLSDPEALVPAAGVVHDVMAGSRDWQFGSGIEPLTFAQHAVACAMELNSARSSVRAAALLLLADIGRQYHTPIVLPFLSDDSPRVRRCAAGVLAKIGGTLGLDALDVVLKANDPRWDEVEIQHLKKCRDELEKRLKKHPIPKDLIDGIPPPRPSP